MNTLMDLMSYLWLPKMMDAVMVLVDRPNYSCTPERWKRKSSQLYHASLDDGTYTTMMVSISRDHCHVTVQRDEVFHKYDEKPFVEKLKKVLEDMATITIVVSMGNADIVIEKEFCKIISEKVLYSPEGMKPNMSVFARNVKFVEKVDMEVHRRLFQHAESYLFMLIAEAKENREVLCTTELDEKALEAYWYDTTGGIPSTNRFLSDGSSMMAIDAETTNMLININLNAFTAHIMTISGVRNVASHRSMLQKQIVTKLTDNSIYLDELDIRYRFQ